MKNLTLFLCLFCLFAGCRQRPSSVQDSDPEVVVIPFQIHGTLDFLREGELLYSIMIEIAETDSTRMRGMMQRDAFPEKTGMLFIFQQETERSFWMANTPVALDLLFINADSTVIDIHKYARPFSKENITSSGPARFVLEVQAGFVDSIGIIETDRVSWTRTE